MSGIANVFKTVFTKPAYTGLLWLVLRVFIGYEFLSAGIHKVWPDAGASWVGSNAIGGFMKGALAKGAQGAHPEVQAWYVDLINNVFLPNAVLFSALVAIGEVLVGLAMLTGLFTKAAAVGGITMNLAFLAAGTSSSNPQMIVMQVAMVFAGAGVAYYGLDRVVMPYLAKVFKVGVARPVTAPAPSAVPVSR